MASNEINYTSYTLEDIRADLTARLALQGTWKDGAYLSSTGAMLIDLFAAVGSLVLYYIERRAEESYIGTAKNRSSLINLVRLVGYSPRRAVSSTGTLRFSIASAHTKIIYIPKWTECQTGSGLKFLVSDDVTIMPGQTYVDVTGVQGELISNTYTSSGSSAQEYNIPATDIENTNVYVTVNGESWTEVDSFINSTTISEEYVVRNELDDTITILFGDNVFGKAPSLGDSVVIEYVKTDGVSGNVYTTGTITTLNDTILDELDATQTVTVTNTTTFLGGEDIETTEEIRYNAPRVFATGDRAVTKDDFVALLEDYSGVANVNVWGEAEETNPDIENYNRVKISMILQNWALPGTSFQETISEYLYTKSLMTVRYTFVDPTIVYVIPTVTLKVNAGNTLSRIESLVSAAIEEQFVLGTTTKLGTSIRYSDVFTAIDSVAGVGHSYLSLKIYKELESGYDSTYDFAETLDATSIVAGSVDVYIGDDLAATDDGLGHFTDLSSDYTITGDVSYTTGAIGIHVAGVPAGTVVSVRYNQDENGDVVVTKSQIAKLQEVNFIDVSYV